MRLLCGLLLEKKEALNPPTHKRAFLAFLPVFQWTRREGDEETKTEIKRRAEAIAILTAPASQSVRLDCDGSTRWICEKQLSNFYFSPLCNPGYRRKASGKFLWETMQEMPKKSRNCFLSLVYIISYRCVSVWGICVSLGWVMNSCQQAGTASSSVTGARCMFARVITDVYFSTCCRGTGAERWVRKGVIVQKPVGWMQTRERQLIVWSWVTCGQVLAGWLLCALSWKTICWDDSIKGNHPARKPLVITQAAFQAGECKTGMRNRGI